MGDKSVIRQRVPPGLVGPTMGKNAEVEVAKERRIFDRIRKVFVTQGLAKATVGGTYRSQMTSRRLKSTGYGRRWMVESFMSGLKRTTGSALSSRSESALFNDAALRVLSYAIRR